MPELLDKRLVIVTGKGGVGKSTVALAMGLAAAAEGRERSRDPNYQRDLGLALAYTDAAYSIVIRCGELYHEYAREAMEGGEPFGAERTFRIYGQLMSAHKLCWEAGDLVFRAGSTTAITTFAALSNLRISSGLRRKAAKNKKTQPASRISRW